MKAVFRASCLLAICCVQATAQDEPQSLQDKLRERFDINPRTGFFGYHRWKYQSTTSQAEQLQRAGCPNQSAPWATWPDDSRYLGYYVGGGAAFGGESRYCSEGTWGWDYATPWARVRLNWFHGQRNQAGEGQYNPERRNNPLSDLSNP